MEQWRHRHHRVREVESLLGRQAPTGAEQFVRQLVDDVRARRHVGPAGPLYGGRQLNGRITGLSQLDPPTGQEVFDHGVLLFVPGGAGGHGPGLVGGIPADGRVDLGRAGGVDLPGFFGDTGDRETAQAA